MKIGGARTAAAAAPAVPSVRAGWNRDRRARCLNQSARYDHARTGAETIACAGGQVDALVGDVQIVATQLQAGTVRALAVTGRQRAAGLPDVPTMREAGLAGVASEPWFGFIVAARTPGAIVRRLQDALAATHDDRG